MSSKGGASCGPLKKLSKEDRSIIDTANELLNTLEQSHRADLALHLYSTHLLKTLLRNANRKKSLLETGVFIKTQIKDNWTSWPNPYTVIDPQTNKLFEDDECTENISGRSDDKKDGSSPLETGDISVKGLEHACHMLKLELGSVWQRSLIESSSLAKETLDIDKMSIPDEVSTVILGKLDHFFEGLHTQAAKLTKIDLTQSTDSSQLTLTENNKSAMKVNKKIRFDYRDIIARGCQMGEDMTDIYIKSLGLYKEVPTQFKKSDFRLPKQELNKYKAKQKVVQKKNKLNKSYREDYVEVGKLANDRHMSFKSKKYLRLARDSSKELSLDKKTFFMVKGYGVDDSSGEESEGQAHDYTIEDCLMRIPRKR